MATKGGVVTRSFLQQALAAELIHERTLKDLEARGYKVFRCSSTDAIVELPDTEKKDA